MRFSREDEMTEFKESLSQLDKGLKSLTAMLNRNGKGTVYFGVDDNGMVNKKITVGKNTFSDIRNRSREMIDPQVVLKIEEHKNEEGNTYISVYANGHDIPYSFDGKFYIRTGDADEKISTNILRKMLLSGETDILKEIPSDDQDLSFKQLGSLLNLNNYHVSDSEEFYRSFSLINEEGKYDLMAYLLSDKNSVSIKTVRFDGTDKAAMSMRTEYGNRCLLCSLQSVLEYIRSICTVRVDLKERKRKETPLFDYEAFQEAWINACLHNSWQENLPPAVYLFDDRIEVVSYGGLPYKLSKENFFRGVSMPVNRSLLFIFAACGLAEQTGHGVPKIVRACGREAFSFAENTLTVTIPFAFEPEYVTLRKEKEKESMELSINQKNVALYLEENSHATLQETAEHTGLSLAGVKKIASKLQEAGFLRRLGSKKAGYWKVYL